MGLETRVLIIGGGATGTGLARDLALRGVDCLLAERRDLASGASGANHGLLHSGARYVAGDGVSARECAEEADLLRTFAPHVIEDTGGLFVAVPGDDEDYATQFPDLCARAEVDCERLEPAEARRLEPCLAPDVFAAFAVRDGAIDPFRLCLDNMAQAVALGARAMRNTTLTALRAENGRVSAAVFRGQDGKDIEVRAEVVVNAAGAWAEEVASTAGVHLPMLYSMGTLVITQDRLAHRVINRLRHASDADILVPGGTVSIIGTTSTRVERPDHCRPTADEVDRIIDDAKAMIPVLAETRFMRAYAGVRPLVGSGTTGDDRDVSRGFALFDHADHGITNFLTITGGKLTTYRLMAEKAADLVCAKLGLDRTCRTRTEPLPPSASGRWTWAGASARHWVEQSSAAQGADGGAGGDLALCECEMVSAAVVDEIVDGLGAMRGRSALNAIARRSRVGKGPCQGGFCAHRITAHLYDRGLLKGRGGIAELRSFVNRRWWGKAPVLWGRQMVQADLQEALHCGMMGLELVQGRVPGAAPGSAPGHETASPESGPWGPDTPAADTPSTDHGNGDES